MYVIIRIVYIYICIHVCVSNAGYWCTHASAFTAHMHAYIHAYIVYVHMHIYTIHTCIITHTYIITMHETCIHTPAYMFICTYLHDACRHTCLDVEVYYVDI